MKNKKISITTYSVEKLTVKVQKVRSEKLASEDTQEIAERELELPSQLSPNPLGDFSETDIKEDEEDE